MTPVVKTLPDLPKVIGPSGLRCSQANYSSSCNYSVIRHEWITVTCDVTLTYVYYAIINWDDVDEYSRSFATLRKVRQTLQSKERTLDIPDTVSRECFFIKHE